MATILSGRKGFGEVSWNIKKELTSNSDRFEQLSKFLDKEFPNTTDKSTPKANVDDVGRVPIRVNHALSIPRGLLLNEATLKGVKAVFGESEKLMNELYGLMYTLKRVSGSKARIALNLNPLHATAQDLALFRLALGEGFRK